MLLFVGGIGLNLEYLMRKKRKRKRQNQNESESERAKVWKPETSRWMMILLERTDQEGSAKRGTKEHDCFLCCN